MLVGVALLAAAVGVIGLLTGAWNAVENASVDARFSVRPVQHPHNLLVVAIDEPTLDAFPSHWPFPRSLDARDRSAAHRRRPHDRLRPAVHEARPPKPAKPGPLSGRRPCPQRRARHHRSPGPTASTTCWAEAEASPTPMRASAVANFRANSSGVIQQYPVLDRRAATRSPWRPMEAPRAGPPPSSSFADGSAWIDFPGPWGPCRACPSWT